MKVETIAKCSLRNENAAKDIKISYSRFLKAKWRSCKFSDATKCHTNKCCHAKKMGRDNFSCAGPPIPRKEFGMLDGQPDHGLATLLSSLIARRWVGPQILWRFQLKDLSIYEPWHEISNNVVCETSKASDQPAHTRSLIRAFASRFNILWVLSSWRNIIWSF